jgi:hypothetical protein
MNVGNGMPGGGERQHQQQQHDFGVCPSPEDLCSSRENSVHDGSNGGSGVLTPEMQMISYPLFFCDERHEVGPCPARGPAPADISRLSSCPLLLPEGAQASGLGGVRRMRTDTL